MALDPQLAFDRWSGGDSWALISAEDLAPTLLAAAGLEAGAKMSGVAFLPLLKGEAHTLWKYLFVERSPHSPLCGSGAVAESGKPHRDCADYL